MSAFPLQTGSDFIFARLHGLWSKAAHGERLRKLTACVTEELLLQSLNNIGLEINRNEHFQKKIAIREISLLQNLVAWADEAEACFIHAKIRNIADENLKVLLNYRFFPEHEINVSELMIPIPGEVPYDCQNLLAAPDMEKFLELLPDCAEFPELSAIIRKLEQDKDFTASDCAIDSLSFQQEMATAKKLSFGMRGVACELVGWEIDITNLSMLLRNVNMYHIDNERLKSFWIPFGNILPLEKLEVLGKLQTIHEVIDALPPPFAAMLHPYRETELYHSEHALWNWLEKKTYQIFRDFSRPGLSFLAYPYLLHFETINLNRIYEGIRFGMPSSVIQEMMIGL
ncbi:MAG: V-type ATPase subunit [Lentisphaeria bacterium]